MSPLSVQSQRKPRNRISNLSPKTPSFNLSRKVCFTSLCPGPTPLLGLFPSLFSLLGRCWPSPLAFDLAPSPLGRARPLGPRAPHTCAAHAEPRERALSLSLSPAPRFLSPVLFFPSLSRSSPPPVPLRSRSRQWPCAHTRRGRPPRPPPSSARAPALLPCAAAPAPRQAPASARPRRLFTCALPRGEPRLPSLPVLSLSQPPPSRFGKGAKPFFLCPLFSFSDRRRRHPAASACPLAPVPCSTLPHRLSAPPNRPSAPTKSPLSARPPLPLPSAELHFSVAGSAAAFAVRRRHGRPKELRAPPPPSPSGRKCAAPPRTVDLLPGGLLPSR